MSDFELKIRVVEAHGVRRDDPYNTGSADPFIIAKFKGLGKILTTHQTAVIHNTANPVWNEDFTLHPKSMSDVLFLKVYDHDSFSKDNLLGMVEIPLEPIFQKGVQENWLQLMKRKGAWKSIIGGHPSWTATLGQLHIKMWFGLSSQANGCTCPKAVFQTYHHLQGQFTPSDYHSPPKDATSVYRTGYNPIISPYTSPSTSPTNSPSSSSTQLPTITTITASTAIHVQ